MRRRQPNSFSQPFHFPIGREVPAILQDIAPIQALPLDRRVSDGLQSFEGILEKSPTIGQADGGGAFVYLPVGVGQGSQLHPRAYWRG